MTSVPRTAARLRDADPAAHFAQLFEMLDAVEDPNDYANPSLAGQAAGCALAARAAGVRPEAMIAYLRRRLQEAPLVAVGEWFRGVLLERLVSRAILAYFSDVPGSPDLPSQPNE